MSQTTEPPDDLLALPEAPLDIDALTMGVSSLTLPAFADENPAPTAVETPLHMRPSHPLDLAPAASSSRSGTGVALAVVALGAGVWVWKRKKGAAQPERRPSLVIKARQTIGVRSELLIVEVAGQSLLLGVTPSGIQRLAVLPDAVAEAAEAPEPEPRWSGAIGTPWATSRP